jgi:uncharacterized membrane protein
MTSLNNNPRAQLAGMLAIAAATGIAFAIGEDVGTGIASGLWVGAFALAIHFGRGRIAMFDTASGVGDERTRHLSERAYALTSAIMAFVLVGWWLVTVVQGDVDERLSQICAIYGAVFLISCAVVARRG